LHFSSLQRLEGSQTTHHAAYYKAAANLQKKKERAFKIGDISKWEMSAEDIRRGKELLENKEEAFKAMFFKDQEQVETLKDNHYFFVNQCYKEIRRTNRYEMLSTHINYMKLCDRIKAKLYEDLQIWTDFEMKYKEEKFPPEKNDIYHVEPESGSMGNS
jgi:hypothetical protein